MKMIFKLMLLYKKYNKDCKMKEMINKTSKAKGQIDLKILSQKLQEVWSNLI